MDIFTYGSLMYPAVWRRVVTGEYTGGTATLRGYARRRIRGELYPGLVRSVPESAVEGILYRGVSAADVAALDRFEGEGEAYARIRVPVELSDGAVAGAWTYLYLVSALVEESPWEPERFATRDLARFVESYRPEGAPDWGSPSTENR
jgi:gamma-glutamylcyclotransferase (GGCT)/AIG2-like uncharacterized protein YtfP